MSAVRVVQQMINAGVMWAIEGSAVKLQCGQEVPPDVVQGIHQNRQAVMHLVRKNPTGEQLAMLAELEGLNLQWDQELEKEKQGFPGETEADVLARLAPIVNRATDLHEALREQNRALVEGVRCLYA